MSSPNKKPSPTSTPESTQYPSLPNDLLLSCFARVSELYYPTLSLAYKSFRSLIASPELYHTRSLFNRTETRLYVCLQFPTNPNPRWFTLCLKPDRTIKNKSSGYALAPIPIPHSPPAHASSFVIVGTDIYGIGGLINNGVPSSSASILDCLSHKWREAPCMRLARNDPSTNVFDGKIYVAGGCKNFNSSNWMEVFYPVTQTWEFVSNPFAENCGSEICKSAVIDEKIYMFSNNNKGMAYKPKEDRWEVIIRSSQGSLGSEWSWLSYCVIDDVLYCYSNSHRFRWYNTKIRLWSTLDLEYLPMIANDGLIRLVNYGGKMAVFWDYHLPYCGDNNKMIWCAVIALEKSIFKIRGKIEWFDLVLIVPEFYEFVAAMAAIV